MTRSILYSTNVYLKLLIQEKYFNDKHFVWCSEYFDMDTAPKYSSGTLVAPSANPASIYKELKRDVAGMDKHSAKITAQRASFTALAIDNLAKGNITEEEKDEIIYMANDAPFQLWRPLLYLIPFEPVKHGIESVPILRRAGFGNEYIIKDLQRHEFDIIEL